MFTAWHSTLGLTSAINHKEHPAESNQYDAPISINIPQPSRISHRQRRGSIIIRGASRAILTSLRILSPDPDSRLPTPERNKPGDAVIASSSSGRCDCSKKESNLVRGLHTNSLSQDSRFCVTMRLYMAVYEGVNPQLVSRYTLIRHLAYAFFINCLLLSCRSKFAEQFNQKF